MDNLQVLTTQRLMKLIDETQLTLQELKEEVIRRERLKQEREVMDLDHHMKSAELNLTHIKNFIAYLIGEHKDKK
ncbi:hypothetical protein ACLKMH_20715 [Psychromonas sp. KJ10-10]|uniref:hypothetical protein n=1 Tax=Psychromonas sp. KJ10-10 TaxID=3391823 RepID=UPI0039B5D8D0